MPSNAVMSARPEIEPQRVLLFQSTSIFETYGGIEYYLDDFSELCASEWGPQSVRALVPQRGKSTEERRDYSKIDIPYSSLGILRKVQNRFSPSFLRAALAEIRRERPTLLIAGHVSLAPLVWLVSRLTSVPYVTFAYGIEVWGDLWPQDDWALRQGRGIVSISDWTRNILIQRGFNRSQIALLHPQLPRAFHGVPLVEPQGKPHTTLLTVSRLEAGEQYKGHDDVLRALAQLAPGIRSGIRYIIQGDGSDRARLQTLCTELGITSMVEFRGAVKDRSELESVYREADIFVMPSKFGKWQGKWRGEGFGIVYLEAAAFGLPSIAYDCGGVTDIITNGQDGVLVPPNEIGELSKAIGNLATDREKRGALGRAAYQHTMDRFTQSAIREEFLKVFSDLDLTGNV